ncbi:hypothetical protein AB205_0137830, partial [Aquarana catesbeiana]
TQQEHEKITHSKNVNEEAEHQDTERPELHKGQEDNGPPQETGPATEHPVEVEEEHKKELEEEEMEQVGKPERLVEEQDQVQEEQEQHRQLEDEHRGAGNEEEEEREEDTNMFQEHEKRDQTIKPEIRFKSAYEERIEQQKLAAQQEAQSRYLKDHQNLLHQHILQQQQMHNNDLDAERQNKLKEITKREHEQYDNIDHDIVQGEEEQHLQEEGGGM